MNAVNFDAVDFIPYPVIAQPKLNGVRAMWDGSQLVSRQCKLWNPAALPEIFEKLKEFSKRFPGIKLDGELYCHEIPFQDICKRVAINRIKPHADARCIEFVAFDIIDHKMSSKDRLLKLEDIYYPTPAWELVLNQDQLNDALAHYVSIGYEGLMLRLLGQPYLVGRSQALIKLKPWKYFHVKIVGMKEGLGKYKGMIGAIQCELHGKRFYVSGGLSDADRVVYWQKDIAGRPALIKCRELSKSGIPLQPQLAY